MKKSKNIGELLTFTEDEKIPFMNDDLIRKVHECASVKAVNKKLIEEYSQLSVEFNALIEYMEKAHPDELKKLYPKEYEEKGDEDGDIQPNA